MEGRVYRGNPREAVQRVKEAARLPVTNWFAGETQLDQWSAAGALTCVESEGAVLLFRRDRDFHNLYYVATDVDALGPALALRHVAGLTPSVFTAEIVGRPADVPAVVAVFQAHGFQLHVALTRMGRLCTADDAALAFDPEVSFAGDGDRDAVQSFLEDVLDPYRDRIPDADELAELIAARNILLIRRGAAVGGVLIFETTGLTSHLRYWYVNQRFRDKGIGARLIRTFLHLSSGGRRIILWVVSGNADAIAKYRHYGFQPESLVDWIMIDKGEAQR